MGPWIFTSALGSGSGQGREANHLSHNLEARDEGEHQSGRWGTWKLKEQPASSPAER
jgi:hypothetical protein